MQTNAISQIRETLKQSRALVRIYQKLIGYNPGAKQWCRVVMDRSTEEMISQLNYRDFTVLEISGRKWKNFGFANYRNEFYPAFDLCNQPLAQTFDLVIAEQVFEHLKKPYRAGKNVFDMLKPGGYFLMTTPFLIKIHPSPDDCTRWSPSGLRFFLEDCGFDMANIQSYSWGNRQCVRANFADWVPFNPSRHSLKNEDEFPIVVWALARK